MPQIDKPLPKCIRLLSILFVWFFSCTAISAQENSTHSTAATPSLEEGLEQTSINPLEYDVSATRLNQLWRSYLEAKALGGDEEAAFEKFVEWRSTYSAEIFEAAAYLFLEEGMRELALARSTGDFTATRREFHHARDMNPYLWPAYAGLAHVNLAEGKYQGFMNLDIKGFTQAFSFHNTYFIMDFFIWLIKNISWIIMIALAMLACILVVKYSRPCYTTTLNVFEQNEMSQLTSHLFTIILLIWPLALGFNFYITAALYLLIFFPFFNSAERKIVALFMLAGVLLPLANLALDNVNHARSNPLLKSHLAHFFDGDADRRIATLSQNSGSDQWEDYSAVTIGLLRLAGGDTLGGLEAFESVPANSKLLALAEVNKGNVQFESKEYQGAIDHYNKALEVDPTQGEALYNLGVVSAERGDHNKAENFKAQAARNDEKIREIIRFGSVMPGVVLPAHPDYVGRFLSELKKGPTPDLAQRLKQPVYYLPFAIIFAILVSAMIHGYMRNPSLLAKTCRKCGRVYYQSDSPKVGWCSQCVNLYVRKEDLPSEAKNRKFDEVKAFNKQKRMVIAVTQVLAPGSKKLLGEEAFGGGLVLFFWVVLLVFSVSPITHIAHPFMDYLPGLPLISWVWMGITSVFWIIFGLRPIWQED